MKYRLLSMLAISGLIFGGAAAAQERVPDLPQTSLQVVGGFSTLTTYQDFELPFWTKTIPELSEGRVTATIKGYNEMGLKGPEVLRLISQGIIPIGTATLAYFASDNPINEAIDLAGINPTAKIAREVTDAFAPIYRKYYLQRNIKVLGLSTYPAQVLFCNADIKSLADIKGKKVRASSRTVAEFIQALGGLSVTMSFAEVVPAMQNKVIDCAVSGSMSGYSAKWYEVATHLYALPINWNQQLHAANLDFWNKLDPRVQEFIQKNIDVMIDRIWDDAAKATQEGYDCNTDSDACPFPTRGKMTLVEPTEADRELLKKITTGTVVPSWAARCSAECVKDFNETVGKLRGITAVKAAK